MTANAGDTAMSWSAPKEIPLLTNRDSHIDMIVIYKEEEPDAPYHAFIKNEKSKVIEHWKAPSVGGDYEYLGVPGDDWGDREGPTVAWIGSEWVMYADDYHGTVYYATSGDSYTWGDSIPLPAHAGDVRHGTLLHQR